MGALFVWPSCRLVTAERDGYFAIFPSPRPNFKIWAYLHFQSRRIWPQGMLLSNSIVGTRCCCVAGLIGRSFCR